MATGNKRGRTNQGAAGVAEELVVKAPRTETETEADRVAEEAAAGEEEEIFQLGQANARKAAATEAAKEAAINTMNVKEEAEEAAAEEAAAEVAGAEREAAGGAGEEAGAGAISVASSASSAMTHNSLGSMLSGVDGDIRQVIEEGQARQVIEGQVEEQEIKDTATAGAGRGGEDPTASGLIETFRGLVGTTSKAVAGGAAVAGKVTATAGKVAVTRASETVAATIETIRTTQNTIPFHRFIGLTVYGTELVKTIFDAEYMLYAILYSGIPGLTTILEKNNILKKDNIRDAILETVTEIVTKTLQPGSVLSKESPIGKLISDVIRDITTKYLTEVIGALNTSQNPAGQTVGMGTGIPANTPRQNGFIRVVKSVWGSILNAVNRVIGGRQTVNDNEKERIANILRLELNVISNIVENSWIASSNLLVLLNIEDGRENMRRRSGENRDITIALRPLIDCVFELKNYIDPESIQRDMKNTAAWADRTPAAAGPGAGAGPGVPPANAGQGRGGPAAGVPAANAGQGRGQPAGGVIISEEGSRASSISAPASILNLTDGQFVFTTFTPYVYSFSKLIEVIERDNLPVPPSTLQKALNGDKESICILVNALHLLGVHITVFPETLNGDYEVGAYRSDADKVRNVIRNSFSKNLTTAETILIAMSFGYHEPAGNEEWRGEDTAVGPPALGKSWSMLAQDGEPLDGGANRKNKKVRGRTKKGRGKTHRGGNRRRRRGKRTAKPKRRGKKSRRKPRRKSRR
jgi:hypothetical protein